MDVWQVFQVRHRQTRGIYAMKVLKKKYVLAKNQVECARIERNVMIKVRCCVSLATPRVHCAIVHRGRAACGARVQRRPDAVPWRGVACARCR